EVLAVLRAPVTRASLLFQCQAVSPGSPELAIRPRPRPDRAGPGNRPSEAAIDRVNLRSRPSVSAGCDRSREPAPEQGADDPEAVGGGELLALLGGPGAVVDRDLEDALAALDETSGDLRLDREAGRG